MDNAAGPCRERGHITLRERGSGQCSWALQRERSYNITGRGEVDSAAGPCREKGHITLRGEGKWTMQLGLAEREVI